MTETIFFIVEIEGRDGGPNVASPTLSPAVFERVRHWVSTQKLAVSRESVPPDVQSISVRCGVKDVRLPYLLHMIRSEGWIPWPYYPLEGDKSIHRRFYVRTCRSYLDKELAEFPYLWSQVWGKRWMAEQSTAEWLAGRKVCRVSSVASGWKQRNGLAGGWNFVVHEEVRKGFAEAGLKGLGYERLLWDDPKKAKADFWLVTPSVLMPPCLTPVWDKHGKPDFEDGLTPPELRFDGNEVKALGEFDAAWTREVTCLGHPQLEGTHRMVVSQRFREVAKKLKLHVTYAPVRLDAPPPELPWIFTADSPPANA